MPPFYGHGLRESVRGGQVDDEARAADRDGAAVALGDRAHDREAEPEPPAGSAPEPLEGVLGLLGRQTRALVADGEAGAVAVALDRDRRPGPGRGVRALRDEVADGALERRPLAEHVARLAPRPPRRRARLARELGQVDGLAAGRRRRVLARERQQVVEQHAEPRGVGLDVGQHLGVGAVPGRVGEVAAQGGQRRAQLVRGVADEALLGRAGALERGEHRVERLRQRADLVAHLGIRQPARGVAGALDLARARRQAAQRAQRAPGEDGGERRGQQRGDDRGEQHEAARACRACPRSPWWCPATTTAPPAAGAAAELAERRGVDAQRVGAEARRRRSRPCGRRAPLRDGRRVGQDAAAEAARAGDDPPARVDHLHEQLAAAEPALERAGLASAAAGWRRRAGRPRSPAPAASGRARR